MRLRSILLTAALLLVWSITLPALAEPIVTGKIEPPHPQAVIGQPFSFSLMLKIAPHMHINGPAAQNDGLIPTKVSIAAPAALNFAKPGFPPAKPVRVQFADKPVTVYNGLLKIKLSGEVDKKAHAGVYSLSALVSYQACDDQVCHMPATLEVPFSLKVSPAP